jgi:hypothetical protein
MNIKRSLFTTIAGSAIVGASLIATMGFKPAPESAPPPPSFQMDNGTNCTYIIVVNYRTTCTTGSTGFSAPLTLVPAGSVSYTVPLGNIVTKITFKDSGGTVLSTWTCASGVWSPNPVTNGCEGHSITLQRNGYLHRVD